MDESVLCAEVEPVMAARHCGCDKEEMYTCKVHRGDVITPDQVIPIDEAVFTPVRTFATGASRDTDDGKYDYEGFLSPLVLERFAAYMHKNRVQKDGSVRDSDNWQKGMPLDVYMKSGFRHFMDWWREHRRRGDCDVTEEALCALLFNVQGYLHELLKARGK